MSRQRAGWGLSRFMDNFESSMRPKSETAGVNKYRFSTLSIEDGSVTEAGNISGEGEASRRLRQLEKLKAKADRIRAEVK